MRRKPYLWFCLGRYSFFAAMSVGFFVVGGFDMSRDVLPMAVGYGGSGRFVVSDLKVGCSGGMSG